MLKGTNASESTIKLMSEAKKNLKNEKLSTWSKEDELYVCENYNKVKLTELTSKFDCYPSDISNVLKRNGLSPRESKGGGVALSTTAEQEKLVCESFKSGNTVERQLAKQFNLTRSVIRRILSVNGLK